MNNIENSNVAVELRRGVITLAVLLQLRRENHGYALRQALTVAGIPLKEGTIYPLLRRLEAQGMLLGRWDVSGDRMRKYYSLTHSGARILEDLHLQWTELWGVVHAIASASSEKEKEHAAWPV